MFLCYLVTCSLFRISHLFLFLDCLRLATACNCFFVFCRIKSTNIPCHTWRYSVSPPSSISFSSLSSLSSKWVTPFFCCCPWLDWSPLLPPPPPPPPPQAFFLLPPWAQHPATLIYPKCLKTNLKLANLTVFQLACQTFAPSPCLQKCWENWKDVLNLLFFHL